MRHAHIGSIGEHHSTIVAAIIFASLAAVAIGQLTSAEAVSGEDRIGPLMDDLIERGVPVLSWHVNGSTLSVSLASRSATGAGTPDDPLSLSLVERSAFLAKSRGADLSDLELDVRDSTGEPLFAGTTPIDTHPDSSWTSERPLSENETLTAVETALTAKIALAGFSIDSYVIGGHENMREITVVATTADIGAANRSAAGLMIGLPALVDTLNTGRRAQIAIARLELQDRSGRSLLKWIYDAQRRTQNWWQAPGITTDWFETPGPQTVTAAVSQMGVGTGDRGGSGSLGC